MYNVERYFSANGETQPLEITFSELTVNDNSLLTDGITSPLVGTNYADYAQNFAEGMVWRLSNYAHDLPPNNAINGQLWYSTQDDELNIFIGQDYDDDINSWKPLADQTLTGTNNNIIPTDDNQYDIGTSEFNWNELHANTLYVDGVINSQGGTNGIYTNIDDIIAHEAIGVVNTSTADGSNLEDAINGLYQMTQPIAITVEVIHITAGGIYNLEAQDHVRYRINASEDTTINLVHYLPNVAKYYEIISVGVGTITLTNDIEITVTKNSGIAGNTFTYATFSLTDRDDGVPNEEWHAIGNFI